jgi:hypothetical protein
MTTRALIAIAALTAACKQGDAPAMADRSSASPAASASGANMIRRIVALALALVPQVAHADPAKDRAALTDFATAYQATAKLGGAERTNQACLDAAKLKAAGSAFSWEAAPANAPVDDSTWSNTTGGLAGSLQQLVEVCKAPDRKLRVLTDVKTADQVVMQLDKNVKQVLNAASPRALSPGLKAAQAAIAAMLESSSAICAQQPKLMKALAQCRTPPAGVAAAAWNERYRSVKNIADDLRPGACGKHRVADEQIGSSLMELHDGFYQLILLVPPS